MKKILLLALITIFGYGLIKAQTVSVGTATNVTAHSATISGDANPDGGTNGPYDVVFKWWEDPGYGSVTYHYETVATNVAAGSGNQTYTFNLTGLNPNKQHYWTIFLGYGGSTVEVESSQATFTTLQTPQAITGSSSNITKYSADLSGSVTLGGSTQQHDLYFQYRKPGDPWSSFAATPSSTTTDNSSITGTLSGLDAATTYEWRMHMEDQDGTFYEGSTESFTTNSPPSVVTSSTSDVTQTVAKFNGSITASSGDVYAVKFRYRVLGAWSWIEVNSTQGSLTGNGSAQSFDATVSGLDPGTDYEVEAFAVDNSVSPAVAYYANDGTNGDFTTDPSGVPTMTTGSFSSAGSSTARITANQLTDDGGLTCDGGVVFGTSSNPTTGDGKEVSFTSKNSVYDYDATLSSLNPATHYYARAYGENTDGVGYGTDVEFYTEPGTSANFSSISGLTDNDHTILTLNFSPGDGTGRIIVAYYKGAAPVAPKDGNTYSADPNFGSGSSLGNGYVLYSGSGANSLNVTGLDGDNHDYDFYIYEYAGSGSLINYKYDNPGFISTDGTEFPIELISFTAKSTDNGVEIKWSTASEWNNDYFEIERSLDAENFEPIARVAGAGYSNEVLNYSITDYDALQGVVYYRLSQTDYDGTKTSSFILPVTIGDESSLQISNVITDDSHISFVYNNSIGGKTQIQLLDVTGKVVKTREVSGDGSQLIRFGMSDLSHGVYVIHLTVNDETIVKKVVF